MGRAVEGPRVAVARLGNRRPGVNPGARFAVQDGRGRIGPSAFSPNGRLLATANARSNSVSITTVAPDRRLTRVPGSPFRTAQDPNSITFSPNGRLLATVDYRSPEGGDAPARRQAESSPSRLTGVRAGGPYRRGAGRLSRLTARKRQSRSRASTSAAARSPDRTAPSM
jgi:hypothetical protein